MSKIGNCLSKIFDPGEEALQRFKQCSRPRQFFTVTLAALAAIFTLGLAFAPVFRSLVDRVKTEVPPVADKVNEATANMESNPLGQTNPKTPNNATIEEQLPVLNQSPINPKSTEPQPDNQPKPQPHKQDDKKDLPENPSVVGNTHPDLSKIPIHLWHTLIPVRPLGNNSANQQPGAKPATEGDLRELHLANGRRNNELPTQPLVSSNTQPFLGTSSIKSAPPVPSTQQLPLQFKLLQR